MYTGSLGYYGSPTSAIFSSIALVIIPLIVAIVLAFVLYFTFLSKKNDEKYTGFKGWLYNFLSFKTLFIDFILRITYIILAIYFSLLFFICLFNGETFVYGLCGLIFGNIVLRVCYELIMLTLILCRNVTDINAKMAAKNQRENAAQNKTAVAPEQMAFSAPKTAAETHLVFVGEPVWWCRILSAFACLKSF